MGIVGNLTGKLQKTMKPSPERVRENTRQQAERDLELQRDMEYQTKLRDETHKARMEGAGKTARANLSHPPPARKTTTKSKVGRGLNFLADVGGNALDMETGTKSKSRGGNKQPRGDPFGFGSGGGGGGSAFGDLGNFSGGAPKKKATERKTRKKSGGKSVTIRFE